MRYYEYIDMNCDVTIQTECCKNNCQTEENHNDEEYEEESVDEEELDESSVKTFPIEHRP